jgi:hypothetical protein
LVVLFTPLISDLGSKQWVWTCTADTEKYRKIDDLRMTVLDQIPNCDRPDLPIQQVVGVIPRLLFHKSKFRICAHDKEDISCTSVFIPGVNRYAHLTGILFTEDIRDITDFHDEDDLEDMQKQVSFKEEAEYVEK